MFLKRIVLQGFKSFADRTEIEFGAGVTCIVGPNGCGKSNVLDALRWVLGEQSARSLRGTKMSDVIFSGSRSRKPMNAAEVQIDFDNSSGKLPIDQTDVSVGRVLYRNGDSEYRINGKTCRRKDIRNLLLDTGVGIDAYSVIEQGRVDRLLQAGPLERREIFEEAAGISRYKVQRTEAQRKLERSQTNLLRLADVVEELERRLRSVKLAAAKAQRFREHDQRLRELRSSFSLAEYHELQNAHRAAAANAEALSDEVHARRVALAERDAEAAELSRRLQRQDERIQAADSRLLSRQTEVSTLVERIVQNERRDAEFSDRHEQLRAQVSAITERAAAVRARVDAEEAQLGTLVQAAAREAERIAELRRRRGEAEAHSGGSRSSLEKAKSAAFEAIRQSAILRSTEENLDQQGDRLRAQAERLVERQRSIEEERAVLTARRAAAGARSESLDGKSAELAARARRTDDELAALSAQARSAEEELVGRREQRGALLSRVELLEDLERRHEGVDAGTRTVLSWGDEHAAEGLVQGLVADVLRIDDPRVACLQSVLATFENHVVVRDAYRFLAALERHGALPGPVSAHALDRIPAERGLESYANSPGVLARALDWVVCAAELRPLAEHLLGRVIIVDQLERALALAAEAAPGYTFVTLEGYAVGSDGRVSVGAHQAATGLIQRKADIRRLRGELDEAETRIEQLQRRRAALAEQQSDVQLQRSGLLDALAAAQKQHAEARGELTRAEDELRRLEREAGAVGGELTGVRGSLHEIEQRFRELRERHVAVSAAQRSHESQVDALQAELGRLEEAVSAISQELTDALVDVGRTTEKRRAAEDAVRDLRSRLAGMLGERDEAERGAREAARAVEVARQELADARERHVQVVALAEQQRAAVAALRTERQLVRQRIEACGAAVKALHAQIEELEAGLHQHEVELREVEVRRDNLVARVRDELSLDLGALYGDYDHAERDWEAVKQEIAALREKIARLGNVNLDAIAELDELTPRYESLVAQRDDLVSSITKLEGLIEELNRESRTRFVERFEQIRANFQGLFRKLFGGGKADIILENPDDPLECGIEVIARPPGKEPQSISLLSGGEKTMAAVSLLLAVFESKPSPFTVLDEVDAALDEANVERFNMVIQDFLAYSQFVIITHNKRTMQCADVLYGVTMEEPGVSKRVAVRFDNRLEASHVA